MKKEIHVGATVKMPEPNETDTWHYGDFLASVQKIRENGNLIVEDADGDCFEVEPFRVEIVED